MPHIGFRMAMGDMTTPRWSYSVVIENDPASWHRAFVGCPSLCGGDANGFSGASGAIAARMPRRVFVRTSGTRRRCWGWVFSLPSCLVVSGLVRSVCCFQSLSWHRIHRELGGHLPFIAVGSDMFSLALNFVSSATKKHYNCATNWKEILQFYQRLKWRCKDNKISRPETKY